LNSSAASEGLLNSTIEKLRKVVLEMSIFKKKSFFLILILTIIIFAGISLFPLTPGKKLEKAPVNPKFLNPPTQHFGLVPHPVDISHLTALPREVVQAPSAWDWRVNNGVTPVKDQSTCGSCWAFAAIGDFESTILVNSGTSYGLAEENLKECNYYGYGCGGGNAWAATNYFTRQGIVLEICDPYHAYNTGVCKTTCSKIKQVTGWRILPDDVATIQHYVYNYGPCYTTMYASFPGFSSYDGSYVIYYTGIEATTHAVMIVGWDDSMPHAGGTGAWICKNSWGTSWGENGFFYIAYDSARIGEGSCYYHSYKHYDYLEMLGTLYHYDEGGWYSSAGFGSPNNQAWGLVRFTPTKDDCIHAVDFWAVDDNMTATIYIYDDFDGTDVSNLLYGPHTVNCTLAGYYSEDLTTPIWVKNGDKFIVVIDFNCTGYYWPVPIDQFAPIETNKTYISQDGSSGSWLEVGAGYGWDVSIRARTKNHQHVFAGHDFNGDGTADIAVWRPSDGKWYIKDIGVYPWGTAGDIPVPGDYNGDGTADIAVWRPSDGKWYIKDIGVYPWGTAGDIPVPGDYNGDGTADIAVWRSSDGKWYIKDIGVYPWGTAGDIPVPGDYNGDLTTDIAVWRPSMGYWFIRGVGNYPWGTAGDIPVPGDYNGDVTTDIAVWRSSDGKWYIKDIGVYAWGTAGDIPVPGDYNGDVTTDIAVWRSSDGKWYIKDIGVYPWGTAGDIPLVR